MNRRTQGFTLIELMVVVIIIASLAAIILPNVMPATNDAKRKIVKADIAHIGTALKLFRLHHDRYPTAGEGLGILMQPPKDKGWNEPYLEKPAVDPWKNPYYYQQPSTHGGIGFDLWSAGPDGQSGNEDDVTSWADE